MIKIRRFIFISIILFTITACGGGSGGGDYDTPPPAQTNTKTYSLTLSSTEVPSGSTENGSATAEITLDLDSNELSGAVTLDGVTATSVSLRLGVAGESGAEVIAFDESSATSWTVPQDAALSTEERDNLDAGLFYIDVATTSLPDGALRAQLLPDDYELFIVPINTNETFPLTGSAATAVGFVTLNSATGDIAVRAVTTDFPNAVAAHVHNGFAGQNGGVAIALSQDANDVSLWSNTGNQESLDSDGLAALSEGALYFNFHSAAFPGGEIRGQIVPAGIDLSFTQLVGGDVVVPGMSGVSTTASAIAASTVNSATRQLTTFINTQELDDAIAVTANQAPEGQNGPSIIDFTQDSTSQWSAVEVQLNDVAYAALMNQGVYFTVATNDHPEGEVRGQLIPADSTVSTGSTFQVTQIDPETAAELNSAPSELTITFNRDVLPASLNANVFSLTASGNDGSFGEANDVSITGISAVVSGDQVTIDISAVGNLDNDVYQIRIEENQLTDTDGIILDGNGDGFLGGVFVSTFSIVANANPNATFSAIQTNVFSSFCTQCHSGATPPKGLDLSSGNAYGDIVGVASVDRPALQRIEPGNPDNSYLIRKLEGGPDISGSQMPLGQPALSQTLIDDIREWVTNGAENN